MIFSENNTDRKLTMFETRLRKRGLRSELKSFQRLRFFADEEESVIDIPSKLAWIYANADAALKLRMERYFEQDKEVTGLLASLTEQTEWFKARYLDRVEEWAKEETVRNIERKKAFKKMILQSIYDRQLAEIKDYEKWAIDNPSQHMSEKIAKMKSELDQRVLVSDSVYYREDRFYYGPSWKTNEAEMIKRSRKHAKDHFEAGLVKMVDRIEKKDMIADQCVISNLNMDVNIEATVTDGNKEVTLYTIIASGPIQRPHYRYLCH